MNHRKIKFKAWDKEENKMHDVMEICCANNSVKIPIRRFPFSEQRPGLEVIEYTGIDYNEVEIYEGFLFEGQYGRQDEDERDKIVGEVRFERGAFVLFFEYLSRSFEVSDLNDITNTIRWVVSGSTAGVATYYQIDSMKLIGNKFESPELI